MKILGITGPTGAGKTTALNALESLGAAVIDADAVYHRLLAENGELCRDLTDRFGPITDEGGGIDRKKLAGVVFADPKALEDLNAVTHRYIREEIGRLIAQAEEEGRPAAAIDAIRLWESGLGELCHATVAVVAPAEVRLRRVMEREGVSEDYARARVNAQKGEDFYRRSCGYTLENGAEDTPESFRAKALTLFAHLL